MSERITEIDSKNLKAGDVLLLPGNVVRKIKAVVADPEDNSLMIFFGDSDFLGFVDGTTATVVNELD